MRPFTVPSAALVAAATSAWLRPRVVGQPDRLALVGRQRPERTADRLLAIIGVHPQMGFALRDELALQFVDAVLRRAVTGLPVAVDRAARDHGQDPIAGAAPRKVIHRSRSPHLHERDLHDLLGVRTVAPVTHRAGVGNRAMAIVEPLERCRVATADTHEEVAVTG